MSRFNREKKEWIEEVTRNNLYEAALQIITDQGWDALTMNALARQARMAKGTIYNYFENKEDVIYFMISKILKPIEEKFSVLEQEQTPSDPREMLARVLDILGPCEIKISAAPFFVELP